LRKTRLFFPLPMNFSIVILKFGERLFHRRSDSTRLQSLRDLEPMETQNDLASLGLKLRPLREGIVRSGQGRRRVLLVEGQILLAYLLRRPAPTSVLRRYVRAAEQLPKNLKGQPLNLPCWCQLFPSTLALLEGRGKECNQAAEEALISRLNIAVFLAEASPDSADRFLLLGAGRRPVAALFSLFRAGFGELVYRLLRFILNPVRHRALGAITENNP
jgi:NADH dehydrogenase